MLDKKRLQIVPEKPGCYLWKDLNGEIIYVGKAKNLRKRMQQYFNHKQSLRTSMLIKNIFDFEYIIVNSEFDALLLEINLIHQNSPKYNIKLKQLKNYPYLKLKRNPVQLEISYNLKKKENYSYFGPFPEGFGAKKIKKLLETIFPIGKCLAPNSGKPCLNYQMGICPGYCLNNINQEEQKSVYKLIESFLNGNTKRVNEIVKEKIAFFSEQHFYEQSQKLSNLLKVIEHYQIKQELYFLDRKNRDVIAFVQTEKFLAITFLYIRFGKMIGHRNFLFPIYDLIIKDTFEQFLWNYYQKNLLPAEIIIGAEFDSSKMLKSKITLPKKGKKYNLYLLAKKIAEQKIKEEAQLLSLSQEQQQIAIEKILGFFKLKSINWIEFVDISHFQGDEVVGAVVSFKNFSPDKANYRKYNLTNINDDYLNTYLVTYRHFRRKLIESRPFPDIYIVDGKYQIREAKKAIDQLKISDRINLLAITKDKKHNSYKLINLNGLEMNLHHQQEAYQLLGMIQDEGHRFANTYRKVLEKKKLFSKK